MIHFLRKNYSFHLFFNYKGEVAMTEITITFLRHGNTGAANDDMERLLTKEGFKQAGERQFKMNFPEFDLILSSPAIRAKHTAAIVGGVHTSDVVEVKALYPASYNEDDQKELEELFTTLGYAPLRTYREMDQIDAITRYAILARIKILHKIENFRAKNILIVGHAIMINAIIAELNGEDTNLLLDTVLGEVEGFRVSIQGEDVVTKIQLIND
jgi:phosphohistidine phosphatase SixA